MINWIYVEFEFSGYCLLYEVQCLKKQQKAKWSPLLQLKTIYFLSIFKNKENFALTKYYFARK